MLNHFKRLIYQYSLKFSPSWKQGSIIILFSILFTFIRLLIHDSSSTRLNESGFSLVEAKITENKLFLSQNQNLTPEPPEFILINNTTLKAESPLFVYSPQVLGSLVAGYEPEEEVKKSIEEYIVQEGDTLWSLAEKFNISVETICWANNLNKNSVLKPGQKLIILPVSGVLHYVKSNDTLSKIAQTYQAKIEEIIEFNQLANENEISIGDILIIPNGTLPKTSAPNTNYLVQQVPLANNYFIPPVSTPYRLTQGRHWYNAVDFGGKCGSPIFAAAAGEVIKVALTNSTSRWAYNGGGNHIKILHPNGVVTYYGHISQALVKVGDQVSQGQVIALMGGQPGTPGAGLSTGCHLHFDVVGAVNPFAR